MSDWRITDQHRYLDNVSLVWATYPGGGTWEHDHCEFCMAKFPHEVKAGYRTTDSRHWICETCFEDFKDEFHWKVLAPE